MRDWQCGTLQTDFVLPQRLGATYVDEKGNKKYPVMLHRAILGSLERWIGILIEQYSGKFPLWLSPLQVMICTITEKNIKYANRVQEILKTHKVRSKTDVRNEKIGYKIREHSVMGIPIILVVGEQEEKLKNVAIRNLGSRNQEVKSLDNFIDEIKIKILPPDLV